MEQKHIFLTAQSGEMIKSSSLHKYINRIAQHTDNKSSAHTETAQIFESLESFCA